MVLEMSDYRGVVRLLHLLHLLSGLRVKSGKDVEFSALSVDCSVFNMQYYFVKLWVSMSGMDAEFFSV